ncbi:MAG: serpin family protein [Clostridium sp.]|jgi:serine protease inhibitor|nr:serpin family protein [Clostridium sp.]
MLETLGVGIRPEFVANRPFVFVIADEKYDTILFMGKLSNGNLTN